MRKQVKTIYIVVVSDRHCDDELIPFVDRELALDEARSRTKEGIAHYRAKPEEVNSELTESMEKAGWLFNAGLDDAFSVRVETKEVR